MTPFRWLVLGCAAVSLVLTIVRSRGMIWQRMFPNGLTPVDSDDGLPDSSGVTRRISEDDFARFVAASEPCLLLRPTGLIGLSSLSFFVHDHLTERLPAQALFEALGFEPRDFIVVFGIAPGCGTADEFAWTDLGEFPLYIENGARYNAPCFEVLALLLQKDLHVFFASSRAADRPELCLTARQKASAIPA